MLRKICISLVALLSAVAQTKAEAPSLDGTWELMATVGPNGPRISKLGSQKWIFDKNRATLRTDASASIPRDGSKFDVRIDASTSPSRMLFSFMEGGQVTDFAYCIFDQDEDTLMIRMLFPLALGSGNASKEATEAFNKSHYPQGFVVKEGDGTMVFIMRRVPASRPASPNR